MYDLEIFKDDIGVTYDFIKYTKYEDWKETMSHKGCTKDNLQKMAELYETSTEKDKKENKVSKFVIKRVTCDKSDALAYLLASGEYNNNVGKNIAVYKDSDFLNYKEFDVVGISIQNDKLWLTTDLKTSNMKYRTYFLVDNKDAIDMFYKFPVSNEHLVEDLIRFIIRQCEIEKLVLEAFDDIEHGRETDVYPKEVSNDYEQ